MAEEDLVSVRNTTGMQYISCEHCTFQKNALFRHRGGSEEWREHQQAVTQQWVTLDERDDHSSQGLVKTMVS